MYTIDQEYINEIIINKSRFICHLAPVKTIDEANDYLQKIRKKFYDATHNCYAYIIGPNGEISKNSDDGEPSQTAGLPIYNVLQKNNLTYVIAVVTRYFGGIKLGAGGLIRAYGSSVSQTLSKVTLKKLFKVKQVNITFDYQFHNDIMKLISKYQMFNQTFSEWVSLSIEVPIEEIDNLIEKLINITKDKISIEVFPNEYYTF